MPPTNMTTRLASSPDGVYHSMDYGYSGARGGGKTASVMAAMPAAPKDRAALRQLRQDRKRSRKASSGARG